jgi:hypothetical protein
VHAKQFGQVITVSSPVPVAGGKCPAEVHKSKYVASRFRNTSVNE